MAQDLRTELRDAEQHLLAQLRAMRKGLRAQAGKEADQLTLGQKVADDVAATMGSWKFIIIQTGILFIWIVLNVTAFIQKWDPYPFILLNLALSFQAAYAAPFIMMSQNRQQEIDRKKAENDYNVNIKAELEIELLHQKIDELRAKEMQALTQALTDLTEHVKNEKLVVAAVAARPARAKAAASVASKPASAKAAAKPARAKAAKPPSSPPPRAPRSRRG